VFADSAADARSAVRSSWIGRPARVIKLPKSTGELRVYRGNGTGFQGNFRIGVGFGSRAPLF
jgi:hypothetical protein